MVGGEPPHGNGVYGYSSITTVYTGTTSQYNKQYSAHKEPRCYAHLAISPRWWHGSIARRCRAMDQVVSFGQWVKRRRKALDLTQDDLAQQVGCSKELIAKLEGDARRPSKDIA